MEKNKGLVLVTGGSGFIGSHCVKQLLERGYKVRASVRTLDNPEKYQFLLDLSNDPNKADIELVEGNLTDKDCWNHATAGCDYVLHVASPSNVHSTDKNALSIPAVEGVRNIMNASIKNKVKKIVMTSSVLAVILGHPTEKVDFDENDFSVLKNITGYPKSKVEAEKEAWRIYEQNKDKIQLSVIIPYLVGGPNIQNTLYLSGMFFTDPLSGKFSSTPKLRIGLVHVSDVVLAHIKCLEMKHTDGQRYIVSAGDLWMREFMALMYEEYHPRGYAIPNAEMWWITFYIVGWFVGFLKHSRSNWNKCVTVSNAKSKTELKMDYIDNKTIIKETCEWALENGLIKRSQQDLQNQN